MTDVTDGELSQGAWSTLRSEPMAPIRICLPTDDQVATSTIRALAEKSIVQILDQNGDLPITQRRYKQEVASCLECARLLRGLQDEVIAANEEQNGLFDRNDDDVGYGYTFTDLEQPLEKLLSWYQEVAHTPSSTIAEMEHREVLLRSGDFLAAAQLEASPRSIGTATRGVNTQMSDLSAGLLSDIESQNASHLQCLSGVILTMQEENFNRALFRSMRGLVITQFKQIEEEILDPQTQKLMHKSAFTTFFHGSEALQRVMRIANGYNAHMYDVPTGQSDRKALIQECEEDIEQIGIVIAEVMPIKSFVKRELVVYRTLNMFQQSPSGALLVADCWIPEYASDIISECLEAGMIASNVTDSPKGYMEHLPDDGKKHPTYIRTNKFTAPFQGIVNTYGIPRYQEINPGFFAIAMFPFLFGIMFGDIVHGFLLLMFALYLIVFENSLANHEFGEIFQMVYSARYLLLIMGVCATYMGFIYNEALSVAFDIFGHSKYPHDHPENTYPDMPYIFGVDSIWRHSNNLIQYTNSLKMKMSIIVGVAQMTFGIFLKLFNNLYFSRYVEELRLSIYAVVESIPEILFMSLTFGYMSVLIFLKWSIDYTPPPKCFTRGCEGVIRDGHPLKAAPPSIIEVMINMFKMQPLAPEHALFNGQERFQQFILTIALISLPVLLMGKPLYIKRKMDYEALIQSSDHDYVKEHGDEEEDHDHNFGDVVVHQGIHTIEFALGCVSNTASYLRLWALSLAHSQLSEVFWEYILVGNTFSLFGISPGLAGGWQILIPSYFVFFCCTIGILMGMESLSAFLHALRLQWVEFQTKFYSADGILFVPLSFDEDDVD